VTFGSPNLPVEEICAISAVVDDPEDAYDEYEYDGKSIKIYDSQPIALADGEFAIDEIKVKISDFGIGLILGTSELISSDLRRRKT